MYIKSKEEVKKKKLKKRTRKNKNKSQKSNMTKIYSGRSGFDSCFHCISLI